MGHLLGAHSPGIWGHSCEADPGIPGISGLTVKLSTREPVNHLRDFEATHDKQ